MAVEERTDLLKYNIARHMKDLLGLDFIEIRLLDRATNRLIPLLTEGMTPAGGQPRAVRPQGGQRRDRLRGGDRARPMSAPTRPRTRSTSRGPRGRAAR